MTSKLQWHIVSCDGEAHRGSQQDSCMLCFPLWNRVFIPVGCKTVDEWRDLYRAAGPVERARLRRQREKARERYEASEQSPKPPLEPPKLEGWFGRDSPSRRGVVVHAFVAGADMSVCGRLRSVVASSPRMVPDTCCSRCTTQLKNLTNGGSKPC